MKPATTFARASTSDMVRDCCTGLGPLLQGQIPCIEAITLRKNVSLRGLLFLLAVESSDDRSQCALPSAMRRRAAQSKPPADGFPTRPLGPRPHQLGVHRFQPRSEEHTSELQSP